MARPLVALLSDFGLSDHYVAAMKAVILGIAPDATLVDITHEVPPHDILVGALELAACYRYFPIGTIFLAVVDPGVGSDRLAIAARAGDYSFVAPDNGLLAPVLEQWPRPVVVELAEPRFARPAVSRTFEGRDRFAPAAAWLARGTDIHALGPEVPAFARLALPRPNLRDDGIAGEIVLVDRFGNLISNVGEPLLETFGTQPIVRIGGHEPLGIVQTYAQVAPGDLCALVGSGGYLEVAVRDGSAAKRLDAGRGAKVSVLRR
jgi:S-adenosylmethionine hydrolase